MADQTSVPIHEPVTTQHNVAVPNPASTARIAGHPIHPMLIPFPMTCFIGALVTDLVYWRTADMQWANFSIWLITAGLLLGALAALTGLIDLLGSRQLRHMGTAWAHGLGNVLVMLLSLVNAFIHSRDAYTSVVPTGLILSGVVVLIMAVTGWLGGTLVYKRRAAVAN